MNCNSFNDCAGGDYCSECSHASWDGQGADEDGREWRWEFNPRFGPLFLGKRGEPLSRQPGSRSKVWPVFEKWLDERKAKGGDE